MRKASLPFILTVVVCIVGCKGQHANIVGTWEDNNKWVKFEFSADKSFKEFGPNSTTNGNWTIDGDTVTLSNLSIDGKEVTAANKEQIDAIKRSNKPEEIEELNHRLSPTLALGDDGTTLTPDESNKQQIPILHKSSSTPPIQASLTAVGSWDGEKGLSVFFNEDKTFLQNGQLPMTGHWVQSGRSVHVIVDQIGGHPIDYVAKAMATQSGRIADPKDIEATKKTLSNIEYTISADGHSITQHASGISDATFKRRL